MDEAFDAQQHPALQKDDAGLMEEIRAQLKARPVGDPYSEDGSFAATLATLPPGLRAMAVTHWLDISLTLDSITWHFGNFGESHLIASDSFFPARSGSINSFASTQTARSCSWKYTLGSLITSV